MFFLTIYVVCRIEPMFTLDEMFYSLISQRSPKVSLYNDLTAATPSAFISRVPIPAKFLSNILGVLSNFINF